MQLDSPYDLCNRLRLVPSDRQKGMIDAFMEGRQITDISNERTTAETRYDATRCAAVLALWRLIVVDQSRVTVIGATDEEKQVFGNFLFEITTRLDTIVASVCHWRLPNVMQLGPMPNYELRIMSSRPEIFQGLVLPKHLFVILGASDGCLELEKTEEVLVPHLTQPESRMLRVW